jgi:hypothetical protein
MDQMIDHAGDNGIYLQFCIDPYGPGINYETFIWGNHPYVIHFLNDQPRPYDVKRFFYEDGDPLNKDTGVQYYWKRKYKYLMARWGYSVNIAAIEPFNEFDQLLTYRYNDLGDPDVEHPPAVCNENKIVWPADPDLPATIDTWFTDMAQYVRGEVDFDDPAGSPLGETNKLFLASYAVSAPEGPDAATYYQTMANEAVDLISAHRYFWLDEDTEQNVPDGFIHGAFLEAQAFREHFPSNNPNVPRKPFIQGESNYLTSLPGFNKHIEYIFHNYDVSFHNELWASAFSGKFAAGTTWLWERVFWWPNAFPAPPNDLDNFFQQVGFSNILGEENSIDIGTALLPVEVVIKNQRLHHHFKPLTGLLNHLSWTNLDFFNGDYSAHTFFDETNTNVIEAYYLKDASNTMAIGWVHNRNAWAMNNYYLRSDYQNFLGCTAPEEQSIVLPGFEENTEYHITWFPTRMNSAEVPNDDVDDTGSGTVTLDLSSNPLGGTLNNYLDTLHADYAFIITPAPFVRGMQLTTENEASPEVGWDYTMYPNPAREGFFFGFSDEVPKDIVIGDLAGRQLLALRNINSKVQYIPLGQLAKGVYWVRVSDGVHMKAKKLIIH